MKVHEKRLSPGQSRTNKFPVVGEREPAPFTLAEWQLTVDGLVQQPLQLAFADLLQLPAAEKTWDAMCVTGWTHVDVRWRGVLLQTLLALAQPVHEARFVRFVAYSLRNHDTSLALDYACEHVLLAYAREGQPLERAHGYPLRAVTEAKYFYKSVKWLKQITLLHEDQLGYWERTSAYHNEADPWREQRYEPRPMETEEFQHRLRTRDFRDAFAIKDPQVKQLQGTDLSGSRFERAQMKGCDFSRVVMRLAGCHGANFTCTKFVDADLRGADLSRCDLEGADFRGADLSGADLRHTSLTATRFFRRQHPAKITGARLLWSDLQHAGVADRERHFLLDPQQGAHIEGQEGGMVVDAE